MKYKICKSCKCRCNWDEDYDCFLNYMEDDKICCDCFERTQGKERLEDINGPYYCRKCDMRFTQKTINRSCPICFEEYEVIAFKSKVEDKK